MGVAALGDDLDEAFDLEELPVSSSMMDSGGEIDDAGLEDGGELEDLRGSGVLAKGVRRARAYLEEAELADGRLRCGRPSSTSTVISSL